MAMHDYWRALSTRQRIGLAGGALVIVAATAAGGWWALSDPLVPLVSGLPPERQAAVAAELERDKVSYRIGDDGETILVPASAAGKARAAMGNGGLGLPPSAGLELFKEADFSTTDFAQRVNYQRALQGELTRTLQTIAGVRSARVHVILPESGILKRSNTKASVAVTLQLAPGKSLSRAQVGGIQRLAAASVPEIKPADVVVLDESGNTLSRSTADSEGEASASQLDLKRQVDGYLEGKLSRLLAEVAPAGQVTLSADTSLDFKQLRVTTEEPIAAGGKGGEHPTGVVSRERQSQRSVADAAGKGDGREVSDWEYEYKVGHRVEQSLSMPGAIKRLSVAVAIHGAPEGLTSAAVEQLVEHAVGIDRTRGDSVAVVLLPAVAAAFQPAALSVRPVDRAPAREQRFDAIAAPLLVAMALVLLAAGAWQLMSRRQAARRSAPPVDIDAATARVRAWLHQDGVAR